MKNNRQIHQPLSSERKRLQREYQREPRPLPDFAPQGYVDCSYWPDEAVESENEIEPETMALAA